MPEGAGKLGEVMETERGTSSTQTDEQQKNALIEAARIAYTDAQCLTRDQFVAQYAGNILRAGQTVAPQTPASEQAHDEWWNSLTPDQRWQFQTGHQIASGAQPEGRTPASERAAERIGHLKDCTDYDCVGDCAVGDWQTAKAEREGPRVTLEQVEAVLNGLVQSDCEFHDPFSDNLFIEDFVAEALRRLRATESEGV